VGIEYKILCEPAAVVAFDKFLRRQPFFESYDETFRHYNLRDPQAKSREEMPDAVAALEPDGIYFRMSGPSISAAWMFYCVIDHVMGYSEKITIYEP
jgi:hypothetical protein